MSTIGIPYETLPRTGIGATLPPPAELPDADRKPLSKKETAADHPTWCPGCGDFSVLALYYKLIEKRRMHHEKGARFTLIDRPFELPLTGEYNVRNAAMAISAAHFYGVPFDIIQRAVSHFHVRSP